MARKAEEEKMKIRINRAGDLQIERPGGSSAQFCPFRMRHIDTGDARRVRCGDQCPLFGEPVMGEVRKDHLDPYDHLHYPAFKGDDTLTICQGRVLTGEIIDERKSGS